MSVRDESGAVVYEGTTHFGFFTVGALAQQVGLRGSQAHFHQPGEAEAGRGGSRKLDPVPPLFPDDPSGAASSGAVLPAKALLMIDRIDLYLPEGGPRGLGFIRGTKRIDPKEWFFAAHFFQDPVCPGSLGLESLLQLLKFAALRRFGVLPGSRRFAPMLEERHRWTYRGQILPSDGAVTVEAVITRIGEAPDPFLIGDGLLQIDGRPIYRMEGFGVRLVSA